MRGSSARPSPGSRTCLSWGWSGRVLSVTRKAAHWFAALIGAPADFSAALRRARATVSSWPGRPRRHPLPDASPSESLRAPPSRGSHQPRFTCRGSWPSRDLTRARPRSGRRIRGCAIQAPSLFQGPDGRWIRSPNRAEARPAVRPRAFRLSTDAKASTASLRSVLRFSQPLDGLLRARARGFVSPRCHVQDPSRSGCSPRARPPSLFERSCPLAVTRRPLTAEAAAMERRLGFEAFIRARVRCLRARYSPARSSLPSSGSSPPGLRFLVAAPSYSKPPLVPLPPAVFAFALTALRPTSAYHPRETRRDCLQNRQPARVFEPSAR
jgi:hypothetical protein